MSSPLDRTVWFARLALAVTLGGCASGAPATPSVHIVSGRVRLTGFLVGAQGQFLGTQVVNDADGVRVDLCYGSQVVASTLTQHGLYRFTGIGPGGYRARLHNRDDLTDSTRVLAVSSFDISVNDTLAVVSHGDLDPIPNPAPDTMKVYYEVTDVDSVDLQVSDLAGETVRTLIDRTLQPQLYSSTWDGTDEHGVPAPARLYWLTYQSGFDRRAQLLFRGPLTGALRASAGRAPPAGAAALRLRATAPARGSR